MFSNMKQTFYHVRDSLIKHDSLYFLDCVRAEEDVSVLSSFG